MGAHPYVTLISTREFRMNNKVVYLWSIIMVQKETHYDEGGALELRGGNVSPEKKVSNVTCENAMRVGAMQNKFPSEEENPNQNPNSRAMMIRGMPTVYIGDRGLTGNS